MTPRPGRASRHARRDAAAVRASEQHRQTIRYQHGQYPSGLTRHGAIRSGACIAVREPGHPRRRSRCRAPVPATTAHSQLQSGANDRAIAGNRLRRSQRERPGSKTRTDRTDAAAAQRARGAYRRGTATADIIARGSSTRVVPQRAEQRLKISGGGARMPFPGQCSDASVAGAARAMPDARTSAAVC